MSSWEEDNSGLIWELEDEFVWNNWDDEEDQLPPPPKEITITL